MDDEYVEYRCSACKKAIKSQVVTCKKCVKLFYHPGCVSKHKIYDKNYEYVPCQGPFEKFMIESDKEADMKKTTSSSGNSRDRLGSTGSAGSITTPSGSKTTSMSESSSIEVKIDWIVRTVKEMKNEVACKKEVKMLIKEVVQEELGNIKREWMEDFRRMIQGGANAPLERTQRSYSEAMKEKKNENIIIIKPKMQQESEATKKMIKEKVDIKNMAVGITKLRKGSKGTVILGCETEEEMEKLKTTVQAKLGENFKVTESPQIKPKIKIVNISEEEIKLNDDNLIDTIKKQNKMAANEGFQMRIVKRIIKEKQNDDSKSRKRGKEGGSVIIETDKKTYELILSKGKLSVGWNKCPVFNHISVKRCFKCWGYFHIAKNCTRDETCHKCAGKHKALECRETKKRCVNCMFKIQAYNLEISDEHDALDPQCPTFRRAIQEEKRRAGWEDTK